MANKWLCTTQKFLFLKSLKALNPHAHLTLKIEDHSFRSASCTNNFCWVWLLLNKAYNRLLFTFGLIFIDPKFFNCVDVISGFWFTTLTFYEHIFKPIETRTFFSSDCQVMQNPMRALIIHAKCSCNNLCMLVILMPSNVLILRYITRWSGFIISHTASMIFRCFFLWTTIEFIDFFYLLLTNDGHDLIY